MNNQANANALLRQAINMVESAGIEVPTNLISEDVELFKSIRTWGKCIYKFSMMSGQTFEIKLNELLLTNVESALQTMLHEVLHTVEGCQNHGSTWKRMANIVNSKYGTNIKRCSSHSEMGMTEEMTKVHKYQVKCVECGAIIGRQKKSDLIKNTNQYRHSCGGRLERVL